MSKIKSESTSAVIIELTVAESVPALVLAAIYALSTIAIIPDESWNLSLSWI